MSNLPTIVYRNRINNGVRLFVDSVSPEMPNLKMLPSFADMSFAESMAANEKVKADFERAGGTWETVRLSVSDWMTFVRQYDEKLEYVAFVGPDIKMVPIADFSKLSDELVEQKLKTIFSDPEMN